MPMHLLLQTEGSAPQPVQSGDDSGHDLCYLLTLDPCHAMAAALSDYFRVGLAPLFTVYQVAAAPPAPADAWQPTADLRDCLRDIVHVLTHHPVPEPFIAVEALRQQLATCYDPQDRLDDDRYFTDGGWLTNLRDLLHAVEAVGDTPQVRLIVQHRHPT